MSKEKSFHLRSWLIGQLRRIYRRYPAYYLTLSEDQIVTYVKSKKGKDLKRVFVTCNNCKQLYKKSEIAVDHIEPVIPVTGFPTINGEDDWNTYIKRLFVGREGLQRLCRSCHNCKSQAENSQRRKLRPKKTKKKS